MLRTIGIGAIALVAGIAIQNYTNVFSELNKSPQVYSKPFWYTVSRVGTVIKYQAEGERYRDCVHKAPLTADFVDKYNNVVARELVRKTNAPESLPDIKSLDTTPNSIIGTPKSPPEPHRFRTNHFIIVTDTSTLDSATNFVVRAECFNAKDGRILGTFGPFPIPVDGDTMGFFPDVMKQPVLTETLAPRGQDYVIGM